MKEKMVLGVLLVIGFVLVGCGSGLSGTYESKNGSYSIRFKSSTECTWYQGGSFFIGTYEKNGDLFEISIKGQRGYEDTKFTAKKDGKDLIITGGIVEGERFVKKTEKRTTGTNSKLAGTTWVNEEEGVSFTFTSSEVIIGEGREEYRETYTVKGNTVTISEGDGWVGKIAGNKITFDIDGRSFIFKKE